MKRIVLSLIVFFVICSDLSYGETAASYQTTSASRLALKIRTMIIPEVNLTNAPLSAVVEYIRQASIELDDRPKDKGVDMLIAADEAVKNVPITLHLSNVSVGDLIEYVCRIAGLEYDIQDRVVVLSRDVGRMITRCYDILPTVFPNTIPEGTDVSPILSRLGVAFPDGASAFYLPKDSTLFVSNTSRNLAHLETVLAKLNVIPFQIEVSCRVMMPNDAVKSDQIWAWPSVTNIQTLVSRSETLFQMATTVSSGNTVSNSLSTPVINSKSASAPSQAHLEFRPLVGADGQIINLQFQVALSMPYGRGEHIQYECRSTVSIYNGATLFFWMTPASEADMNGRQVVMALSARLMDPASRPVRTRTTDPLDMAPPQTEPMSSEGK